MRPVDSGQALVGQERAEQAAEKGEGSRGTEQQKQRTSPQKVHKGPASTREYHHSLSGNAGQNHKETPLHTHWDGWKVKKGTSVGEDEEKLKPSCIASGNINWCIRYGQHVGGLKKLKTELPYDPEISLLGIYSRELSRYSNKKCS